MPSELESFGLAALEAMACEVVPIATRTGGVPEVIEQRYRGYLADVGDVGYDGTLRHRTSPVTKSAFARYGQGAARAVAQARFCSSRIVPQYEAFYRRVVERFRKSPPVRHPLPAARQPYPHQCSLPFMAIDRHPRRIAIQNLEPLGNISHAIPVPRALPASGIWVAAIPTRRPLPQSPNPSQTSDYAGGCCRLPLSTPGRA